MKKRFYVVWKGREPGIYSNWNDCNKQVHGFKGARFRGFPDFDSALAAYTHKSKTRHSHPPAKPTSKSARKKNKSPVPPHKQTMWALFCDGATAPTNPGPSGVGLAVYHKGKLHEQFYGDHEPEGTNNRAELMGLFRALTYTEDLIVSGELYAPGQVAIYSDSQYALDCITKWAKRWKKRGWTTKDGKPVKNRSIIEPTHRLYLSLADKNMVVLRKVKGHAGITGNEVADTLAGEAAKAAISDWCPYAIAVTPSSTGETRIDKAQADDQAIVIATNPMSIGGDTATESIPEGYAGACAVVEACGNDNLIAVLPSPAEARRVARYALTPDGGYGSVIVEPTHQPVTHDSLEAWF